MLQINKNIKLIRELSGQKQRDFAKLIKTNLSNLKTYENTGVKPKANVAANIARFAGISLEDLKTKNLTPDDVSFNGNRVEKVENDKPTLVEAMMEELINRVRSMETNLNTVLGKTEGVQYDLLSMREVVLKSLARLEKRTDENELYLEAGKLRESLPDLKILHGKQQNTDSVGKS